MTEAQTRIVVGPVEYIRADLVDRLIADIMTLAKVERESKPLEPTQTQLMIIMGGIRHLEFTAALCQGAICTFSKTTAGR